MLQFQQPYFLWGLLAALLPVILHFLNWHRPDVLVFPSIRFLERTQLPQEGRRRPRDLVILLLRMLLIALFMLLAARPCIVPPEKASGDRRNVTLADCSASMSGWGHAEKAKAFLNGRMKAGDEVIFSADRVLEPQAGGAYPACGGTGRHSDAILAAAERLAPGSTLTIISDFRRNDWDAVEKCIPADVNIDFLDCGSDTEENVGIAAVRTSPLAKGRIRVIVTVVNYSGKEARRMLAVNASGHSQKMQIELPPLGRRRVPFVIEGGEGRAPGDSGVASLEQDDYALDDRYYFSLGKAALPKALVIGGDEASFIAHAMDGAYQVNVLAPMEVFPDDFKGVQAVFVSGDYVDLSQVPKEIPLVVSGAGNPSLRALRENGRLSATAERSVVSTPAHSLGIGRINDEELRELFGKEADLFLWRIPSHLRLKVLDSSTKVLMESLEGDPLLLKNGNCSFFAFPFGEFVLSSSFLPLLRELAPPPDEFGIQRSSTGEPGVFVREGTVLEVNAPAAESALDRIDADELAVRLHSANAAAPKKRKNLMPWLGYALAACALALLCLREQ